MFCSLNCVGNREVCQIMSESIERSQHALSHEPVTELLNDWAINKHSSSANELRAIVFMHLKGMVSKQVNQRAQKANSQTLIDQLPSATTLLQDVVSKMRQPKEIYESREQFLVDFASFVRWVLLDDLRKKNAQMRTFDQDCFTELLPADASLERFTLFDDAFSELEQLRPRSYKVALLHYFLGFDITQIGNEIGRKDSTIRAELKTAQAHFYSRLSL